MQAQEQEQLIHTGRKLNLVGFTNVADVLPIDNAKINHLTGVAVRQKQIADHDAMIEKAGKGEGSRGGKVIGHTKSGRPVYANGHPHEAKLYGGGKYTAADIFSDEDNKDAIKIHHDYNQKIFDKQGQYSPKYTAYARMHSELTEKKDDSAYKKKQKELRKPLSSNKPVWEQHKAKIDAQNKRMPEAMRNVMNKANIQKGEIEYALNSNSDDKDKLSFNKTGTEIIAALTAQATKFTAKAEITKTKLDAVAAQLKEAGYEPTLINQPYNYLTDGDCCNTFDAYNYRKENNIEYDKPDDVSKLMGTYNDLCYALHSLRSDANFIGIISRNLDAKRKYSLNARQLAALGF